MKYDSDTVQAVMEAYDSILAKYLSEELRNVVWNAVDEKFPAA